MKKKYRYDVVFPDGSVKQIYQSPNDNGIISDSLSKQFKELTGRDLTSECMSLSEEGYKLLYIGEEND